ncbi:GAF domain-containing SpoIIE family protein phosphatase [Actinoplanes couchii]|uniref:GAF domain-containing SpoIIE family protein phosphatase n=1 Tax=Actinoplanes couchii TaxID=403638 RepID=UPI001EF31CFD|nr:SpoIIE family protein phosphatase [Actinoplanes couchii]MDR6319625.1 serine phosphatase RsbU (regulator of sigma subunit) [Actinoplanes couchii]
MQNQDRDRTVAARRTGLTASPDPAFDRFASMVRNVLKVPVALVSLVEADRQVFPGALGLADPWQQQRQTPLSHSFCRHVVDSAQPLVIEDARTDPRVTGNLAITDLNVVGYAGMPLTDETGRVLGSLCAIDTVPRQWTAAELALLADLAAACSDSLQLRITTTSARQHQDRADAQAARSRLLLRASTALAATSTADDVVDAVRQLVTGTLDPAYVGVSVLDRSGRVNLRSGLQLPSRVAERWNRYTRGAATPSALATRTGVPVLLPDMAAVHALTPDAAETFLEMGWQSGASVPLPGPDGPVGALTFVWKQQYRLDDAEQTVLAALAGYVAQALQRADYLFSRENAAAVLQKAMLSDLPDAPPFELAARYEPAARGDHVGGDWYDAVQLEPRHLALVIGDVTGHDMRAAAQMGRLRSKLRLLLVDRNESPSGLLRRLDTATRVLGDPITATATLALLSPEPGGADGYRLHWSNAGHPSPVVASGGAASTLTGHDPLLGAGPRISRHSHTRHLPPGATLLFYTDGLLEVRSHTLEEFDARQRDLHDRLAGADGVPLDDLLERLYEEFAGDDHEDDVALLAVRLPPGPGGA